MYFSRVLSNVATDLSNKAKMQALPHSMSQLEQDSKHITFEFSSFHEKRLFDKIARNEGHEVDAYNPSVPIMDNVESAIDAVVKGNDPRKVLETATTGMLKAYSKMEAVLKCSDEDCLVTIPSYRGRYPKLCPACGSDLVEVSQQTKPSRKV